MRGEFFGLVGINGAGKTTLLKCLLDFCDISGGSIEIFDTPHQLTAARRRLAFLPERFNPPYYLTGDDFIRYVLDMQSEPYDRAATQRMLRAFDLDVSALKLPVRAYSKGMTQKLGLAACLLSRKDLYILDEPASGLDPKAHALLKARLNELKREATHRVFHFSCAGGCRRNLRPRGGHSRRHAALRRHAGGVVRTSTPATI